MNDSRVQFWLNQLKALPTSLSRPHWELPTEAWSFALRNHPDKDYVKFILFNNNNGWTITKNENIECKGTKENYKAKVDFIVTALEKVYKRVTSNYIWGPFTSIEQLPTELHDPTFWPQFYKEELGGLNPKVRILTDFSNSTLGPSFNDNLTQDEKTCSYVTIKNIIRTIWENKLVWLWAMDAHEAYYRVPIRDRFLRYMGFRLCGLIFFYTCLVMGMASSCQVYSEFANVVCWIIINNEQHLFLNNNNPLLLHYIDDFFSGHQSLAGAILQYNAVLWWWQFLGIPTQIKRCIKPTRILPYLGYIFNTFTMSLSIQPRRLAKYKTTAQKIKYLFKQKIKVKVNHLQSMVGQFRSIQVVYPYIIPFLRRWEAITSRMDKDTYIEITKPMIDHLDVVLAAVDDATHNSVPFEWLLFPAKIATVQFITDAATGFGVGGYIHTKNGDIFQTKWKSTNNWNQFKFKPDIVFMELLGVVAAVQLFAQQYHSQPILLRCDNWAVCAIFAKKCACFYRPDLNALMAVLCTILSKYHIWAWITHIRGVDNKLADALSRFEPLPLNTVPFKLQKKPLPSTKVVESLLDCYYDHYDYLTRFKPISDCDCDESGKGKTIHNIVNGIQPYKD